MKNLLLSFVLLLLGTTFLFSNHSSCPDTVNFRIDTSFQGQDLLVHIHVNDFRDIISFQMGFRYDRDVFELNQVTSDLPEFNSLNWSDDGQGELRILWSDGAGSGLTLEEDTELVTLRFSVLQQGATSFIGISTRKYPLEFINANFDLLCAETALIAASGNGINLSGRVVYDDNNDCNADSLEKGVEGMVLEITGNGTSYFRTTDETGMYSIIIPPGNYRIKAYNNQTPWILCDEEIAADFTSNEGELNFTLKKEEPCHRIMVDISTSLLQRCAANKYTLIYKNLGSEIAENASIEVVADKNLIFITSDFSNYLAEDEKITFFLGNLNPGEEGIILIEYFLDCNTIPRQTHCLTATAYPNNICETVPGWEGARITIEASCDLQQNKVKFILRNSGTGPMTSARNYIVTEDDVLSPPEPVFLNEGEELALEFPADGSTYRVTADQDNGFPFLSKFVTRAIEGCTTQAGGQFSTGFFTMFEESDRDLFVDTDCRESNDPFNQALILGMPKGYGTEKFISRDNKLEYLISYKHTSPDTIQNIIIKNKIPDSLDITTLRMGSSSHPYKYRLNHERELWIEFDSIHLINAGISEPFSGLFVKYSISPLPTVPDGYLIINDARIILDLEEEVQAGPEVHTIGTNFVMTGLQWSEEVVGVQIYPNPAAESIMLELPERIDSPVSYSIQDMLGNTSGGGTLVGSNHSIDISRLFPGEYIIQIQLNARKHASVKLVKL